jgi:hypothetical protein
VTLTGTEAYKELLLVSETVEPPVGAGLPRVAVPVELEPPLRLVGLRVMEESAGDVTVRMAEAMPPAVMVAVVLALTGVVVTVKVAVDAPAATVTLAGT